MIVEQKEINDFWTKEQKNIKNILNILIKI